MLKKKRHTYWAVFPKEVFFKISYSRNQRKKKTMGPENGCLYLINVIIYVCYCIFCYSSHGIGLSTTRLSICKYTCCQRKKGSNSGKTLCHFTNRNMFVEWPMLTVNAANYREGNFPNPFLVDFFRTAVRMKNPICN